MLVLALQFSRSDAGQQRRRAERSGPPAVAEGRLPQNGREDGAAVHSVHGEGPNPSTRATRRSTTHQCTNRCVSNRVERVSTGG